MACPERAFMLPERSKTKNSLESSLRERAVMFDVPQKKCAACHSTCLRCRGPFDHDCTECTTESVYREVTPNETYCDPGKREASPARGNLFDGTTNDTQHNLSHKSMFSIFFEHITIYMIVSYIVLVTIILLAIRMLCRTWCCNGASTNSNDKKYAYNRIAYDGTNDHIIMEQEAILHTSDSSEETEPMK